MVPPQATPLPIPTFQTPGDSSSAESPADLLKFLLALSDNLKNDQVDIDDTVRRNSFTQLIRALNDNVLRSFPSSNDLPWATIHENLKLTEISLTLIRQLSSRPEESVIFSGQTNLGKDVVVRLLNVSCILDAWIEIDVPNDPNYDNPAQLYTRVVDTCVELLRCLGGSTVLETDGSLPSWHLMRDILTECLALWEELLSLSPASSYPLYITLFHTPRLREGCPEDPDLLSSSMEITSCAQVPLLIASLADIATRSICPAVMSQWYLMDISRVVVDLGRRTSDYLFSTLHATTDTRRARATVRFVTASTNAIPTLTRFAGITQNMHRRLLIRRIQEGPLDSWGEADMKLRDVFLNTRVTTPALQDFQAVVTALRVETWGALGTSLRSLGSAYLCSFVPCLDEDSLRSIKDSFLGSANERDYAELLGLIQKRLDTLESLYGDIQVINSGEIWRSRVRTIVQALIEPDVISWMEDDGSLTGNQYMNRAITEVESRFEKPIYNPSAVARLALAKNLAELPCAFVHDKATQCASAASKPGVSTIPLILKLSSIILDGGKDEVTPAVNKVVFDGLARSILHHTTGFGGRLLDRAAELVSKGLKNSNRSVRLSAGRALAELVRLYQSMGGGASTRTEPLFDILLRIGVLSDDRLVETALIATGFVGKVAIPEVLYQAVSYLISHMGHPNPIVKGTAYTELQTLAKHNKKSHYNFLAPYFPRIAPRLVSRISTQPMVFEETCRFLSIQPADFIFRTINLTLPHVFAECDTKTLDIISDHMNMKASKLFLESAAIVLSHVFQLPPGQSNKVVSFIGASVLGGDTGRPVDIDNVIRTCTVNLLANLVIAMGDDHGQAEAKATRALMRVNAALNPTKSGQRASPEQSIANILQQNMLGILTSMTESLQDIHGKKNLEAKKQILRSLEPFVSHVGPTISSVAPQLMATLQTMIAVPEFAEVTLSSWSKFLRTLDHKDVGAHVGPTSASLITFWPTFSLNAQETAKNCLDFIVMGLGEELGTYLDEVVDLGSIPQLSDINGRLLTLRNAWSSRDRLQKLLERATSDSATVSIRSLGELKSFMLSEDTFIRSLSSGDVFDPLIGSILSTLFAAACRDGEGFEPLRLLAFDCIGILGAVDPDRFELDISDSRMIMTSNFVDDNESVAFALHLLKDVLIGVFRSTSDISYQSYLAFTIQELLQFCKFNTSLVSRGSSASVPLKVRKAWASLPKHVIETATPLLGSKFTTPPPKPLVDLQHPIYPSRSTYRQWIQTWTSCLIDKVSGDRARRIFGAFPVVVRNKDVGVAHHLLPHLVLNVLISGGDIDAQNIRLELLAVLKDQVDPDSHSTPDKKELSAQTVFMLMDHLNQWIRVMRQDINAKKAETKRSRPNQLSGEAEEQLIRVDSILSSIDQSLMARAALKCKAYARALMSFEQQIVALRGNTATKELHGYYERLHEIYANLDEPDGMEGVSTLILSPSLEHQIRQHESTGRWTSAQSCWEVRLQHSPNDLESHLGLLRCLRNLGHYDTMRTHVKGILSRNPDWQSDLVEYQVESEWMVGDWDGVQTLVQSTTAASSSILLAQILLAMRADDSTALFDALSHARKSLGAPITAAGAKGYRRSYESVLNLHLVHELDMINQVLTERSQGAQNTKERLDALLPRLSARLDSTLPSFRIREPILSIRRTAFGLHVANDGPSKEVISQSWLLSSKLARKAGYWQTAYSAMLQAQQNNPPSTFIESAKLVKVSGEPLRALQELENSLQISEMGDSDGVIDLTSDDNTDYAKKMKAKATTLRARWMKESDRYDANEIMKVFQSGADSCKGWESGWFHTGQWQDECFKNLNPSERLTRGTRMIVNTVRCFVKAIRFGNKYIYQTVPRLLTLWLDSGEDPDIQKTEIYTRINGDVAKAIKTIPVYKWYTAFPQIVSRVGHTNKDAYSVLSKIIVYVLLEYPKQSLWLFASVLKSTKSTRHERGKEILNKFRAHAKGDVTHLIAASLSMVEELLHLCDHVVKDDRRMLSMSKDFPRLNRLMPSPLIIPIQESLTANIPPTSSSEATYQPFPVDAPTFAGFYDEVEVMRSLAKPRKIAIQGNNGHVYMFLGKPRDDLRKDARLMDFNAIINKLLKSNSESRRRQLHIRTYGVVTLNEECGFIQWVPNTIPMRTVLTKHYDGRNIRGWSAEVSNIFTKIKEAQDQDAAKLFVNQVLPLYPPMFHEWFIETFPEPSAWLASRLAYSRTAAVMSIVGYILGLGDRHCENILLDTNSGDVVHVDFNCLFEKGKSLDTPERVPFRLTQNMVDGLGVTGVEGVFRIACEVTMQLLRDNKDSLMSILDAFVHDPLVEWEDEKRKMERRSSVSLRDLARNALKLIEKKLMGMHATGKEKSEKELSTSSLVQILIMEATDDANLAKMYPGWAPWH